MINKEAAIENQNKVVHAHTERGITVVFYDNGTVLIEVPHDKNGELIIEPKDTRHIVIKNKIS